MNKAPLIFFFLIAYNLGKAQSTKVPFTGEDLKGKIRQVTEIICDIKQSKKGDVKIDSMLKNITF